MLHNIFFIIVATVSFTIKIQSLIKAVKEKNKPKIKTDVLLLSLMIFVVIAIAILEKSFRTN